jgi:16S rRNA (adenine1518-N6/adenine1519-N6)-dimethyltransferase
MASPKITVKPKQSLGQNYLIDDNIAKKIVHSLNLQPDNVVVEIGSGQGALTQHLVGKARRIIAVEIDQRVVGNLNEKFNTPDIEIVNTDFLLVPLAGLVEKYGARLRIVGNIPYHLTSPILFKVFDELKSVADLTLMMQREVARRTVAVPNTKDYGILSIFSQYYCTPRSLFNVSPNCFYPKPKVTSTVVNFRVNPNVDDDIDDKLFRIIVKTAFGKRRKTLKNSLGYLPIDKNKIDAILNSPGFPLKNRPEELSVPEYVQLCRKIMKIIL